MTHASDQEHDPPAADNAACRRATGRFNQEQLCSSHGPVLDLSQTGARILTTAAQRGIVSVRFYASPHVEVRGRVVWQRRLGFRRYLVGVRFDDANADTAKALAAICSEHAESLDRAA